MKANGRRRWRKWSARSRQRYRRTAKREGYKLHPDELKMHKGVHLKERKVCGILPPLPSREFSPRSLVGMSQRRRKVLAWLLWSTEPGSYEFAKSGYRLGERLRPCPGKYGCRNCTRTCGACEDQIPNDTRCRRCGSMMTTEGPFCDGSGVLPARGE